MTSMCICLSLLSVYVSAARWRLGGFGAMSFVSVVTHQRSHVNAENMSCAQLFAAHSKHTQVEY